MLGRGFNSRHLHMTNVDDVQLMYVVVVFIFQQFLYNNKFLHVGSGFIYEIANDRR